MFSLSSVFTYTHPHTNFLDVSSGKVSQDILYGHTEK